MARPRRHPRLPQGHAPTGPARPARRASDRRRRVDGHGQRRGAPASQRCAAHRRGDRWMPWRQPIEDAETSSAASTPWPATVTTAAGWSRASPPPCEAPSRPRAGRGRGDGARTPRGDAWAAKAGGTSGRPLGRRARRRGGAARRRRADDHRRRRGRRRTCRPGRHATLWERPRSVTRPCWTPSCRSSTSSSRPTSRRRATCRRRGQPRPRGRGRGRAGDRGPETPDRTGTAARRTQRRHPRRRGDLLRPLRSDRRATCCKPTVSRASAHRTPGRTRDDMSSEVGGSSSAPTTPAWTTRTSSSRPGADDRVAEVIDVGVAPTRRTAYPHVAVAGRPHGRQPARRTGPC